MFQSFINSSFINEKLYTKKKSLKIIEGPKGLFGIPDVVIALFDKFENSLVDLESFAFELKLKNWRRALMQAYRYKAYIQFSYVILDHKHIKPAIQNIKLFEKSNIGLLSIDESEQIFTHFQPKSDTPYCNSLVKKFENKLINTY